MTDTLTGNTVVATGTGMQSVFGAFKDTSLAEKAAGALVDHGARREDLSVVADRNPDGTANNDPLASNDRTTQGEHAEHAAKQGISTTTPGDAGVGAEKGAGIGLGVGILAGLASLFIPGVGLVVGGGALAAAIGGAVGTTVAGAVAGGVTGYLKDMGVPHHVAEDYEHAIKTGGALLSITVPSGNVDVAVAQEILGRYGAVNIHVGSH